ncbi:MAG: DUF1501 domain-containing protein [Rhodothermales bacterium]
MCKHSTAPNPAAPRHGSCLEHGHAHTRDHARWSRRDFLTTMGLATAGGALIMGHAPMRAFGQTPLLAHLRRLETDRVLVLIQCSGGNDGLNTVVPKTNDIYYNARPGIAIPSGQTLAISGSDDLGFHPSFNALTPIYGDGNMAVIQNVGYPDPSLSHFRGTDIWMSASNSEEVVDTGWLGRYLSTEFPDFDEEPTPFPLAVSLGGSSPMLFQGPMTNMGMSLASPELFEQIAEEGVVYDVMNLPPTTYGTEMEFVRSVANDSFLYAEAIQQASEAGGNSVEYPNTAPSNNLQVVAQLIKGQLGARIYHVSFSGFDTHALQGGPNGAQANLLRNLAEGVQAFLADLAADGLSDKVLVMTFSEFGRRVNQNGSGGTDHGTAAPLFLFGTGVEGDLYGSLPNLADLDPTGNLKYDIDFRSVYATVLQDWFGLDASTVQSVLGDAFDMLGFVTDPATPTAVESEPIPESFKLYQNYPNPFNPSTTITYTLNRTEHVTVRIFDVQGRLIQTLVDDMQPAGSHSLAFNAGHLASGAYFYRLQTADGARTRQMTLVR